MDWSRRSARAAHSASTVSRNRAQLLASRSGHALQSAGNLGKSRTSTDSTAQSARIAAINTAPTLKTNSYRAASSQPERVPAMNPLPQKSNSRFIVQAAAFVLALAAVIAIPRYFRHSAKATGSEPLSASAAAPDTVKTDAPKIEVASQPPTQPVAQPTAQPLSQPAIRPAAQPTPQPASPNF